MASGLEALRDDRVHAATFEPQSLLHVVAEETTRAPIARIRPSSACEGRPKRKLTTAGRKASMMSAASGSKGVRRNAAGTLAGSSPSSA